MTQQPADRTPVRVTVYGSCVARDSVDLAGHGRLAVIDYIARQSLLSAGHDLSAKFPADAHVAHRFQKRMMAADFAGDVEARLRSVRGRTDILLWDLTDERHGVHVFDDGTVVTRSIDLIAVPEALAVVEDARHIAFGTDEHFAAWAERADEFRRNLRSMGLFGRTVVLHVPWARTTVAGQPTPASMGTSADEANEAYRRYYDHLRNIGFSMLEFPEDKVLADPEHRWGLAPFHYTQDVYEEIVDRLLAQLGRGESTSGATAEDGVAASGPAAGSAPAEDESDGGRHDANPSAASSSDADNEE
ncbi:DUF6270 domain-containing protein [Brachybacterium sp. GCM10030252]|uniref:DUF6270 domain-containing protein n=1 Tax=Brachybacterium sp. GCM10030252 TaxID=3273380 RepID=UPI003610750E